MFVIDDLLSRAQVTADVFCGQMTADGQVKLTGATVGVKVGFQEAVITFPAGSAIDAEGLRAQEIILEPDVHITGGVDLRRATIGVLHDDPSA